MRDDKRDGLRIETSFMGNGFGIDPEDCRCPDCMTSQAFHPSEPWMLKMAIDQGRRLYNRTGHEVILPNGVRLLDGDSYGPLPVRPHCSTCTCF